MYLDAAGRIRATTYEDYIRFDDRHPVVYTTAARIVLVRHCVRVAASKDEQK